MNLPLLAITFLAVNLDFFVVLLFLLRKYHPWQVMIGYLTGVIVLLVISFLIGQTLEKFLPEWLLGTLGIIPIIMAIKDNDEDSNNIHGNSPILTVLLTYLSVCSGCTLSIFLPVLIRESIPVFGQTVLFIGTLTIIIVMLITWLEKMPLITKLIDRFGELLMKICYIAIGIYVFFDSGLVHHLTTIL